MFQVKLSTDLPSLRPFSPSFSPSRESSSWKSMPGEDRTAAVCGQGLNVVFFTDLFFSNYFLYFLLASYCFVLVLFLKKLFLGFWANKHHHC